MLYKNIKILSVSFIVILLVLSFALFGTNNFFTKDEQQKISSLKIDKRKTDIIVETLKRKYIFRNKNNQIHGLKNIKKKINAHIQKKKNYVNKIEKLKISLRKKELIKYLTNN